MRQVILITICIILAVSMVHAEEFIFDDTLYNANSVVTRTTLENTVWFEGDVSNIEATVTYSPVKDASQQITSRTINPTPESEDDDVIVFSWNNPANPISYGYEYTVESQFYRPRVREEIHFPYTTVPKELAPYLEQQEIIRITPEIRTLASEIIGNEDDAMRAVFALGKWVKDNIEYDLNTVTAEASQTSDWVLETRTGVCDELTSLFIAMLRSQGIPARFVSGIAYTNLETLDTNWGPHGWAEVWFPEVGWVPYDVTYGQFGFVDATHITLKRGLDAKNTAVEYIMESRGGRLEPGPLNRVTTLVSKGNPMPKDIVVDVHVALEETGFASWNRIEVTVTNNRPYYVSKELFLAQTTRINTDDFSQSILLGPHEKQTLYWLVHVDDDLEEGFRYTFPIIVYTNTGAQYNTSFIATRSGPVADKKTLEVEQTVQQTLSQPLSCEYEQQVRVNEPTTITCTYPQEVTICIQGNCDTRTTHSITLTHKEVGIVVVQARANLDTKTTQQLLTIQVLDEPNASMSISAPESIYGNQILPINVTVRKESFAQPENVILTLNHPLFTQTWDVDLTKDTHLGIRLGGTQLAAGENELEFTLSYDGQTKKETVVVFAKATSFGERIVLWSNRLVAWISTIL